MNLHYEHLCKILNIMLTRLTTEKFGEQQNLLKSPKNSKKGDLIIG